MTFPQRIAACHAHEDWSDHEGAFARDDTLINIINAPGLRYWAQITFVNGHPTCKIRYRAIPTDPIAALRKMIATYDEGDICVKDPVDLNALRAEFPEHHFFSDLLINGQRRVSFEAKED